MGKLRAMSNPVISQPAGSLITQLAKELAQHAPFDQMAAEHIRAFVSGSQQRYFATGERVMSPADGTAQHLLFVRRGAVTGTQGLAELNGGAFLYEAGELFPVSAVVGNRAVTATYRATEDCFALALPIASVKALASQSAPFADFLNQRIQHFLSLSRKALQGEMASRVLAEQSMETPLGSLIKNAPISCSPASSLREVLSKMEQSRIGSMLVTDDEKHAIGILTRYDILGRVTLPGVSLDTPIAQVMVSPVRTLDVSDTAQDAALLMSRHAIRHVPITRGGAVVGIVSERDLFAMQRMSLQQLSNALRGAVSIEQLKALAPDIRQFAARLLGQGIQSRQLTALVSHLNDLLTGRLLDLLASEHGLDPKQACWIALGSEGREEQTIATDQDNALILQDSTSDTERLRWLALARSANETLDECGYPLCAGNIMASNAELCLKQSEWQARFAHWIGVGEPEDLLNASIFFDLRGLWGELVLAQQLRDFVTTHTVSKNRFLKLLAINALQRTPPLTWTGAIDTYDDATVDLKLRGTAIFVDAARLYALAQGIAETNTRARLAAIGAKLGIKQREYEGWIGGFEFLQTLRLRVQIDIALGMKEGLGDPDEPNRIDVRRLNTIDRRILKETCRVARDLQDRMRMDYER
ncbi:CBS domain-containing protein [Variovorax sp. PCZ-1]|nr:CBS domain-containing protein [Variovorax sp. PCZ-1]